VCYLMLSSLLITSILTAHAGLFGVPTMEVSHSHVQEDFLQRQEELPSLSLKVPFREASLWQPWRGNPESALTYIVNGKPQQFGVVQRQFVPQLGDTWFVYGLHGYQKALEKPYGTTYPQWDGRHNGIDFVTVPGLTVRAAQTGRVIYAGPYLGSSVIIDHGNGFQTTYGFLDGVSVSVGDQVMQDQEIGHTAAKGPSGQLHFSLDYVEKDGTARAINPIRYLDVRTAVMPAAEANQMYLGSRDPYAQEDFSWARGLYLSL
jgi:murein DD-endopeptidase MepM/ murein hydrolase activator NlpD